MRLFLFFVNFDVLNKKCSDLSKFGSTAINVIPLEKKGYILIILIGNHNLSLYLMPYWKNETFMHILHLHLHAHHRLCRHMHAWIYVCTKDIKTNKSMQLTYSKSDFKAMLFYSVQLFLIIDFISRDFKQSTTETFLSHHLQIFVATTLSSPLPPLADC